MYQKDVLKAVFLMESINSETRYSTGPLYSKKEVRKAKEILREKGYTSEELVQLDDDISALKFYDPTPISDGSYRSVFLVLSPDKHSLFGGKDTSWSNGMMIFGSEDNPRNPSNFVFQNTMPIWTYVQQNQQTIWQRVCELF